MTVLHSMLDGHEADRLEQLVRVLEALSPLSREGLIARTEEIKREKKGAFGLPFSCAPGNNGVALDVGSIAHAGMNCKLALLTPERQRDLMRLSEDYVREPEFLRLGREHLADDSVAVVVARLVDLPLIESKLLFVLGFSYVSRVFLVRAPTGADVTGADVLILAHRNKGDFTTNFNWLADSELLDAKALIEQLIPDAGNKLHLFASEETKHLSNDWISVVGGANWGQSDE